MLFVFRLVQQFVHFYVYVSFTNEFRIIFWIVNVYQIEYTADDEF